MAVDMFMLIDGVKGESIDKKHAGEIDVLSWSWGATQTGSSHVGGGSGTGKVQFQDLTFTKGVCRASPTLLLLCAGGTHFKKAVLTVRRAGGKDPVEYLTITMNDGIVSSFIPGGNNAAEVQTETVSLNFASFSYVYTGQKSTGGADAQVTCQWNIAANAPA